MYSYYLGKGAREMIAIVVHKVITVSSEFLAQFVHYSSHIVLSEISIPDVNALSGTCPFISIIIQDKTVVFV